MSATLLDERITIFAAFNHSWFNQVFVIKLELIVYNILNDSTQQALTKMCASIRSTTGFYGIFIQLSFTQR